jgi:hypothetical protein
MNLWHLATVVCLLWLQMINFLEFLTHVASILGIILIIGWAVILLAFYLVKKKYYNQYLFFEQNSNLDRLFAFGFRPHQNYDTSSIFRSLNIYGRSVLDESTTNNPKSGYSQI